jgi:hypothetical protein
MRSMVEGASAGDVPSLAPSTAFGGPPPPSLRDVGGTSARLFHRLTVAGPSAHHVAPG